MMAGNSAMLFLPTVVAMQTHKSASTQFFKPSYRFIECAWDTSEIVVGFGGGAVDADVNVVNFGLLELSARFLW